MEVLTDCQTWAPAATVLQGETQLLHLVRSPS